MSEVSSYFVAVHTGVDYTLDEYDTAAGKLVALLTHILSSRETVSSLIGVDPESVTSEIEVSLEPSKDGRELVGKAVIDVMCSMKVKFDKPQFSKLVKAMPDAQLWPAMKIAKKQVPYDA